MVLWRGVWAFFFLLLNSITVLAGDSVPTILEAKQDIEVIQYSSSTEVRGKLYFLDKGSKPFWLRQGQRFKMVKIGYEGQCRIRVEKNTYDLILCPWREGFSDHQTDLFRVIETKAENIPAEHGAKPKTQQEWEKCRDKIYAACPGCYGASGDAAIGKILKKCGSVPVQKTSSGYVLFKEYCDGIYEVALAECSQGHNCADGMDALSMMSRRTMNMISTKDFDTNKFNNLCKQVCQTRKMPDRKTFGGMMCGEP